MTENQIQVRQERSESLPALPGVYNSIQSFEDAQRMAKALSASNLVPQDYQGNTANTLIALEMAQRTGSSPMAVMQNLHIIHGRPSWSSQFTIAALNSCGRFSPLRFRVTGTGDDETCTAWAYDKATGEVLEGPPVSIAMAKAEGWYNKNGSKWKTMPQLMLRYRAAKFFGNLYAPDVLMGMHTADEVEDFGDVEPRAPRQAAPVAANDNQPRAASGVDDLNSFASAQPATAPITITTEVVEVEGELIAGAQSNPDPDPKPAGGRRQRRAAPAAPAADAETQVAEEPTNTEAPAQGDKQTNQGADLF